MEVVKIKQEMVEDKKAVSVEEAVLVVEKGVLGMRTERGCEGL